MISAKFIGRFRNIDWLQPSVIAIIIANLVPIIALFVFHWDVFSLLFLFWLENVIVGVVNVLKMAIAGVGAKDMPRYGALIFGGLKFFLIPFFCMHYGLFTLVHGFFIVGLFNKGALHQFGGFNPQMVVDIIHENHLEWPLAALVVSHLISFVWDYLWSGEFRRTNPAELMMQPYRRVVVMHLTVIIGGFLTMALKLPEAALIFLVALKTITDLWGHQNVREKVATNQAASPGISTAPRPSVTNVLQAALQARAAQPSRAEKKQGIFVIAFVVVFFGFALCFAGFVTYNMVSGLLSFGHPHPMPPRPASDTGSRGTYWTPDANHSAIPETVATGRFQGNAFRANRGVLDGEVLTLSDTSSETNRAFVIHFTPTQINATANRIFQVAAKDVGDVPEVQLVTHVKNSKGSEIRTYQRGYSMQWYFGEKKKYKVPVRIYLCLPDAERSFVAGSFKVTIKKDKAATDTARN